MNMTAQQITLENELKDETTPHRTYALASQALR
ncbi:hypothetical protein X772_25275 [Mesorhizobium sp. LSJC280B00]|nr:hypothetical protein X772_25275 [Mesorhizobium sp. LSJC280B00]